MTKQSKQTLRFFFFSLFMVVTIVSASPRSLSERQQASYTSQQEQALGKEFIQMIQSELPIVSDPIVTDYLQNLGFRLVSYSEKPSKHYEFFIVRDSSINAFSGPDGYIGVNSGLILETQSEGELAAVLAHEIAHSSQNHLMRSIQKQKNIQLASVAAMLAAAVIATQNPQAGAGAMSAAQAGGYQSFLNYSREYEQEADRLSIQILEASGFDPKSMAVFLTRMEKEERLNSVGVSEYLRTHPLSASRLADITNRTANLKQKRSEKSEEFPLIQARLTVDLKTNNPQELMRNLQEKLKTKNSLANRYAYALAAAEAQQFKIADKTMTQLIKDAPEQIILKMTQAEIQTASGKIKEANHSFEELYRYHADYYPLLLQYGAFLLTDGQPKKAADMLEAHASNYSEDIRYLALLSEAQGKSKQESSGYQTRAKIYLLIDNKKAAVQQLKMALKFSNNNPYEASIIKEKLKEIETDQP